MNFEDHSEAVLGQSMQSTDSSAPQSAIEPNLRDVLSVDESIPTESPREEITDSHSLSNTVPQNEDQERIPELRLGTRVHNAQSADSGGIPFPVWSDNINQASSTQDEIPHKTEDGGRLTQEDTAQNAESSSQQSPDEQMPQCPPTPYLPNLSTPELSSLESVECFPPNTAPGKN